MKSLINEHLLLIFLEYKKDADLMKSLINEHLLLIFLEYKKDADLMKSLINQHPLLIFLAYKKNGDVIKSLNIHTHFGQQFLGIGDSNCSCTTRLRDILSG